MSQSIGVECNICLEEMTGIVTRLPCGHYYHNDCIEDWRQRDSSCPYCRRPFGVVDMARVPAPIRSIPVPVISVPVPTIPELNPRAPRAYKQFNEANNFISRLWKFFPSLYGTHLDRTQAFTELIRPMANTGEFCQLQGDNTIHLSNAAAAANKGGGFGMAGEAQINEDSLDQDIYAIIVSINNQGGFVPFYIPVILKRAKLATVPTWAFNNVHPIDVVTGDIGREIIHFSVTDPITEMIFGSMLGHLYDCGRSMFYSKFLSGFNCGNRITTILEKSNHTFEQIILNSQVQRDPDILLNLIFQIVYGLYIGKKELGFTHLDFHSSNAMVTFTDGSVINDNDQQNIPYVYQGQSLSTKEYFLFDTDTMDSQNNHIYIAIRNNGLIAKIIDYGACATYLFASRNPKYTRNLIISPNSDVLHLIRVEDQFETCIHNASFRNTMDIQYLLSSIYRYDMQTSGIVAEQYRLILDSLNIFTSTFYGDPAYRLETYADQGIMNSGVNIRAFDDPTELLRGLVRMCDSRGHTRIVNTLPVGNCTIKYLEPDLRDVVFTEENCLIFSENTPEATQRSNMVSNFIDQMNIIERSCAPGENRVFDRDGHPLHTLPPDEHEQFCRDSREEANKLDPENRMSKRIRSPLIDSPFYNRDTRAFNNLQLSNANMPNQLLATDNNMSIFNIQINPGALQMDPLEPGALVYRGYQNWLDFNPIGAHKVNLPVEIVNLNAILINPQTTYTVDIDHSSDIWNASNILDGVTTGFCINAGYFAVPDILNTVEAYTEIINQDHVNNRIPIGFSYMNILNRDQNGTHIAVPPPYRGQIGGVIWCENETNVIHIDTHDIFLRMHQTILRPSVYALADDSLYATDQEVIMMDTGTHIGRYPRMANGEQPPYKWALSSGPILVHNGNVVFDENRMLNEMFQIARSDIPSTVRDPRVARTEKPDDLLGYRLDRHAGDNYKFRGTNNGSNPYDMTSNRYDAHDVMAITRSGSIIFFLIEGRGYNAPGLERVQVAYLVHKFDILSAICLGSGFNANAVYKINNGRKVLVQNNPLNPPIGFSMVFAIGSPEFPNTPESTGFVQDTRPRRSLLRQPIDHEARIQYLRDEMARLEFAHPVREPSDGYETPDSREDSGEFITPPTSPRDTAPAPAPARANPLLNYRAPAPAPARANPLLNYRPPAPVPVRAPAPARANPLLNYPTPSHALPFGTGPGYSIFGTLPPRSPPPVPARPPAPIYQPAPVYRHPPSRVTPARPRPAAPRPVAPLHPSIQSTTNARLDFLTAEHAAGRWPQPPAEDQRQRRQRQIIEARRADQLALARQANRPEHFGPPFGLGGLGN